jgi:mycoredoxin
MSEITIYSTSWCGDCRRAKQFLKERGIAFHEVNVDEDPDAEDLVLRVNSGRRKVPTLEVDGRYFACSPFDPYLLAEELKIPLNK